MAIRIAAILALLIAPLSARPDCAPQARAVMSCCEGSECGSCCCDGPEPARPEPQSTATSPTPVRFEAAPTAAAASPADLSELSFAGTCGRAAFPSCTGVDLRAVICVRNN